MSEKDIEISGHSRNKKITVSLSGIEIKHQGKPVNSTFTAAGYVYLIIDCSGSMAGDKLDQAKKGTTRFAKDSLSKGYFTGLIQFDSSASQLSEPTREISILERCLAKMVVGGSTNMAAAIRLAHRQLMGKTGLLAMVIVTDGMPDNVGDSLKAAQDSKNDDIDIITIGTDDANQEFLQKLSSRAELGIKVSREHFEETIASSAKMLPANTRSKESPNKKMVD